MTFDLDSIIELASFKRERDSDEHFGKSKISDLLSEAQSNPYTTRGLIFTLAGRASANLLFLARQAAGISQEELAQRIRTSQSTIARLEGGSPHGPRLGTLVLALFACGYELNMSAAKMAGLSRFGELLMGVSLSESDNNFDSYKTFLDLADRLDLTALVSDPNDRICRYNEKWKNLHSEINDASSIGTPYREYLEAGISAKLFPNAVNKEKKWIKERLQRHRNPSETFRIDRQDNTRLRVTEVQLPDGNIVTLGLDVSFEKDLSLL